MLAAALALVMIDAGDARADAVPSVTVDLPKLSAPAAPQPAPAPPPTTPPAAAPPADGVPPASPTPPPPAITGVLLGGLDKTTARITKFPVLFGQTVSFGTLKITVADCRKQNPDEPPESAAYLTIDEPRAGAPEPVHWFKAWMFASSPAVSALQHPVYDVWVLDCTTTATGSSSGPG